MAVSERDFGNLEAKVQGIEQDMAEVKGDVKEVLRRMAGLDGGWKVLVGISAIVSAMVGVLLKFIPHIFP